MICPKCGSEFAAPDLRSINVSKDPSLKDKVEKLFNQGMQVDAIADELSCPVSEVQFIIDML